MHYKCANADIGSIPDVKTSGRWRDDDGVNPIHVIWFFGSKTRLSNCIHLDKNHYISKDDIYFPYVLYYMILYCTEHNTSIISTVYG